MDERKDRERSSGAPILLLKYLRVALMAVDKAQALGFIRIHGLLIEHNQIIGRGKTQRNR